TLAIHPFPTRRPSDLALWRQAPALGVGVALATTIAFLPTVAAEGRAQLVRARSVRPLAVTLAEHVRPGDVVLHEGAIENSASARSEEHTSELQSRFEL